MTTSENHHSKAQDNVMGKKGEKEQAHTVMLMELFCEVSNISGSILVNERKLIVCLLMESQF